MESRIRCGAFHPFWTFVIVIELLAGTQAALGQTPCATAPSGLVSWWRAEGNGADTIGTNQGTLQNGMGFATGLVGQAFSFNGTNQYAQVSSSLNPTGSFSIEGWILPQADQTGSIASKWGDVGAYQNNRCFIFYAATGRGLGFPIADASTQWDGSFQQFTVANVLTLGEWNHVAAVYDQATGTRRLFVNGTNVATRTDAPITPLASLASLTIGGDPPVSKDIPTYFHGLIDELSFYQRALSSNELAALYAAGSAGKCTAQPMAVYDVARDFSTNSNPAGIWSYGYSTAMGGDMILHTSRGYDGGLESWFTDIWLGTPNVFHNGTAATLTNSTGTIVLEPGQLSCHPGPNGEFGLVRFTVPSDGLFQITTAFVGADTHGTTTDVYLMQNGSPFFGGQVNGFGPNSGPAFQTNLTLRAGDRLDFAVGRGSNQEFSFDSTGLSAQIRMIAGPVAECASSPGGLVAWWRAEGGASDTVGNNHGEMRNGAAVAVGRVGQAFVLDGVDDLVEVPNSSTLNPAGSFSLEGWIFPRQDQDREIVCKWGDDGDYSNNRSYSFSTTLDRGLTFAISDAAHQWDGAFHVLNVPAVLTLNAWNHVAGVYDQATGTRKLYVNGTKVAERTDSPIVVLASTAKLAIGARFTTSTTSTRHFDGLIDEVSMYGVAMSSTEIQAIYAAGAYGKCPMLTNAPPVITVQPMSRTVEAGSNVTFTVSASGTWPFSYQWFFGDNPLSNGTNSTLTLTGVQPAQAGSYHVIVTNAYGAATSSNALLTVLTYPPTIALQPKNVTAYEGRTATFTAKAAGTAPLTYQWFFNGAALPGETTTALGLANVQSNNAGYYWLTASNGYGSATSSNATLTVLPPPVCISAPTGAVAWWRGESNTLDSIGLNDALLSGSPYTGFYQTGKVGTAFQLTRLGYFYVPASRDLDVGAGDGFTVEGWILPSTLSSVTPIVYWGNADITFLVRSPGTLETRLSATNTGVPRSITLRTTNAVVQVGAWQHVALSFDKATGLTALFVNGVAVAQTNLISFRPQTQAPVYLGSGGSGYPTFAGALDEFTIYGRALAPAEIQAIVTADEGGKCIPPPPVCAPPPASLVAWWRGESNALDSVSLSHGVITPTILFTNGVAGKAFQFMSGYVRVPASDTLNVGAGEGFTIETWVNRGNTTAGQPLVQWGGGKDAPGVSLATASSPRLQANIVDSQGGAHYITTPVNSLISGFQHVALTYDKASGMAALYIRGNLVTQTNVGSFTPRTTSDLYLGYQPSPLGKFTGALDEVALYGRALTAAEIRGIALARGAGKCTEPPTIVEHPLSLRVADGGTARFGAVANGNPLLCYQWLKDGVTVPGATTASLVLSNVQPAQAGTYAVLVTNCFGAALSSNAVLTIGPVATTVEVVSTSADAMETFAVPVVMTATGDENALGFSLNFNPAHLSYVSVEPGGGASDGPLLLNTSQVANGRLGVAVAAMPGMTFPAGTQQVARVFFTASALTSQTVSPISFSDQPLARQLVDAGYQALPVTFTDGSVTIAALDYEGDVSPRPAGDHNTTIADWVLVGRYATRLDYPTNASEFQRADCAPRAKRGDGRIKITDWVQAGRYAVGLDPLTAAGGSPAGATSAPAPRSTRSDSPCTVRIADAALAQGHAGTVSVVLEAQGGEAGVGFSLTFDPAHLRYVSASLGSGAAGAVMNVNVTEASTGRLGVGLVFPAGSSFAAGKKEIVKLTFAVAKDAGSDCEVTFGDLPVACDVSDTDANALSASFVNSALTINPTPTLTLTATGSDVTLAWPLWATNFVLQTATEPVASGWTNLPTSPATGGDENRITLPKAGQSQFFRLYRP